MSELLTSEEIRRIQELCFRNPVKACAIAQVVADTCQLVSCATFAAAKGKSKTARCNIAWLCRNYAILPVDIYSIDRIGIAKNSAINAITHENQPNYANLVKFVKAFQALKKCNITGPADLVYFPVPWGEKENSYLQIRGKIKII